jgi:tetratricopeptide (TPR) repeat protein
MAGLIQAGKQGMADRYMYISMLGLLIIAAWAVKDLIANRPRWKVITAALAGVVLLSAVILTRMQVRHWQNSMALFEYALKVTENNAVAEHGYGCALYEAGRLNEAVPHLSKAAWIDPAVPKVHNNLGRALLKQGRLNEAIACLNEALRIDANQPDVHANLGIAYSRLGKYEPAIQNWTKVAELKPDNADALNNLAWLLATAGNTSAQDADKAIKLAQRACELTGHKDAGLLDTLAAAYAAGGRFDDAVTTASQAVDAVKATDKELNVSEIQERIKLYQTGQRYRQK